MAPGETRAEKLWGEMPNLASVSLDKWMRPRYWVKYKEKLIYNIEIVYRFLKIFHCLLYVLLLFPYYLSTLVSQTPPLSLAKLAAAVNQAQKEGTPKDVGDQKQRAQLPVTRMFLKAIPFSTFWPSLSPKSSRGWQAYSHSIIHPLSLVPHVLICAR